MSRTDAQRRNARAFRFRHSQSLARRRHRFSQAMVLSTIQRLGNTTNLPVSSAEQRAHQQHTAVAVLQVGCMDDRLHQQALRIDEDMPLLALDLLASIEARRIDRAPPFSAPLTLWLSMMAAVGLASRSAISRHFT